MVDRIGPASTIKMAGLCGATAIALVPLLHHYGMLATFILVPLIACSTMFDSAASSAQDSRIPEIAEFANVPLRRLIAAKSVVGYAATLGAPLIAGVIAHDMGTVVTLWHSAVRLAFGGIVAGLAIARCGIHRSTTERPTVFFGFEGFAAIWRDEHLRFSVIVIAFALAIVGVTSAVVVPAMLKVQSGDVREYGRFIAAISGGSILGSVIYGMAGDRLKTHVVAISGVVLIGVSMASLGFLWSPPVMVLAGILLGVAASPMAAALTVVLYQRIDMQLRGRSLGAVSMMITCITALSMIAMGRFVDGFGPRAGFVVLTVVAGIAILPAQKFLQSGHEPR